MQFSINKKALFLVYTCRELLIINKCWILLNNSSQIHPNSISFPILLIFCHLWIDIIYGDNFVDTFHILIIKYIKRRRYISQFVSTFGLTGVQWYSLPSSSFPITPCTGVLPSFIILLYKRQYRYTLQPEKHSFPFLYHLIPIVDILVIVPRIISFFRKVPSSSFCSFLCNKVFLLLAHSTPLFFTSSKTLHQS
jgi:hypothetical protein